MTHCEVPVPKAGLPAWMWVAGACWTMCGSGGDTGHGVLPEGLQAVEKDDAVSVIISR